jgi:hypothetical protein
MSCSVVEDVPGFHGEFDYTVERVYLEMFRDELARAWRSANWPCEARLTGAEPAADVTIRVNRAGQAAGRYQLCAYNQGGARLSGDFALDQTFLDPLLERVEQVLAGSAS